VVNGTLRKSIGVIMIELMIENRPIFFCFSLFSFGKMLVVDDQTSTVESNQAQPSLTFAFSYLSV
jgi:hypothetical protein